jgi:type IV pilus assembly protein PilY1
MGGASSAERAQYVDGFPVITNWDDPLQYACQKNVLLGIGDVYTHRDKNLPGSSYSTDEPAKPALVTADTDVDVVEWTNRVGSLESLGNIGSTNDWSGRNNSAYLAGLAYFANTTDLRTDSSMPGKQTASTHWVDVLEALSLEAPVENQYWLATKWGGFDVPDDFDPATFTGPLDLTLWNTNGQTLVSFGGRANPVGYSFPKPDNYYLAGSANQMVDSLTTAFQNIADSLRSSASSVATNSTRLESSSAVYQAAFDSNRWSADLNAFNINTDGTIDSTPDWNAAAELDSLTTAEVDARNILTVMPPAAASGGSFLATTGVDFDWVQLSLTQQDALRQNGGTPVSALEGEARLEYLRGQRTLEQPSGPFRQRDSRLGDIVNSDPQFIHQQDFGYSLLAQSGAFTSAVSAAYTTYRQTTAYQNRPPLVLVGANDGMLHGFDASSGSAGGSELFAFIPYSVFDNLYELTDPDYEHRYFVDGSPRAADAYLGATLGWRTIVVGGTGAGGRSIFALDISAPSSMNDSDVLWEFSHPDLGNTIGQPAIAPLPNGEFGVIVTDGYLGDTTGHIWILDPADGSITASFTLPNAGDFGAPLVSDLNGDRVADRIYVGDTLGQLWRIDLVGSNTSNWGVPSSLVSGTTLEPLFIAQDPSGQPQPITGALASAFTEEGDHAIFFGTGTFYQVADNVVPVNPRTESFYGVFDRGTQVVGRSSLTEQEILTEQDVDDLRVRAVTQNYLPPADDGWYLDLVWKSAYSGPGPAGERVVSRPLVRDDRVIFTTLIPNPDPCSPGGESWLMELNTSSGGRLEYAVFDLGDDGNFDSDDWITVTLPDGTDVTVPPSALAPGIGIVDSAAVVSGVGPDQDEIKILSGSSGDLIRISERGGVNIGRQSWRQRN